MSETIALISDMETEWADILHPTHERRDASKNRERLLDAARTLFAQQGVANVTMAEIALAAELGKGTLYRRFANKGELCLLLLDEDLRSHEEAMLALLQRLAEEKLPYRARLAQFFVHVAAFTDHHMALLSEVQRAGITPTFAGNDPPYFHFQQMTVNGLLRGARQAGEIDTSLDGEMLADLLLAPLTPPYFRYLRDRQGYSAQRVGEFLGELVARLGPATLEAMA
ncbi:MAG: TetR/AcrR family transcriptional regulator [Chloroflexi bacterium]|nr:MAG: TetR/AcrR family transcriptional regulator [Chloroflexota bacterium]